MTSHPPRRTPPTRCELALALVLVLVLVLVRTLALVAGQRWAVLWRGMWRPDWLHFLPLSQGLAHGPRSLLMAQRAPQWPCRRALMAVVDACLLARARATFNDYWYFDFDWAEGRRLS